MKIVALDLGDQWTGSALSDPLGIIARPYQTIATNDLITFLTDLIVKESITTIVIGLPITLRGTESIQTKKIIAHKQQLQQRFPAITFVLWDERLTSKQAEELQKSKNKEEKIKAHSRAAAFILQSYLEYCTYQKNS